MIWSMAKSISDKICVLLKNKTRNSKPDQEIRLETLINLKKQKSEDRVTTQEYFGTKREKQHSN